LWSAVLPAPAAAGPPPAGVMVFAFSPIRQRLR